jgi:hypothetical protein
MRVRGPHAALLAVCLAACSHGEAYGPPDLPVNATGPAPRRLTFNAQSDDYPAWLPDGSAVGYSWQDPSKLDGDRCLALLAPEEGRIAREICVRGSDEGDTIGAVWAHGVSAGGRLAFIGERSRRGALAPAFRDLYLGRLTGGGLRRVLSFPYISPGGLQLHDGAIDLVWTDDSTLVYLATFILYIGGGPTPPDTEISPIELVRLDLRGDSVALLSVIPGSGTVSSLARDPATGTLYVTRTGSSRVFTLDPVTGATASIYDFAPLGEARDVQVAGGWLVGVVGGRTGNGAGSGGPIYAAQLPGGAPQLLADTLPNRFFRHLALAPGGQRVVAEQVIGVSKATDLWLFDLP